MPPRLVLASASPRRLGLLRQAGIEPDAVRPTETEETPRRGEAPRELARRLAREKAEAAASGEEADAVILGADTVVAVGRRILPKADDPTTARDCLRLLSGRGHRVYTGCCVIGPDRRPRERLVETRLSFKRLSDDELESYIRSGEWRGKAGGYAIQGLAGVFVMNLVGSYSAVVGLPLYETINLLSGAGVRVRGSWDAVSTDEPAREKGKSTHHV